jgi:serine/threonine protein kinase
MAEQGPLSGQRLGDKYLLGELLGQGGFGAVYKAQHLLLNRPQAIKVLLEQHFGSPKFRERFLREAQTLAALDHANILPVNDLGVEGNRAYLVMAFLSGGTLQGVLKARSGPLSLEETARYLAQICAALDYAHKRRVVHLDLKPLNLLIHEDGHLLLSDFGLAHLMEQGAVEGGTSLQFGSPVYMAPEHFDGKPEQRSDLYALGIILYQLLVGHVPFAGASPMALMRQHLTEAPPPLRAVRPDLPPALDAVLDKALAKQPTQRYQTAGELLYEFQAALVGQLLPQVGSSASVFYEQTRLSPSLLPPTVQAVHPPADPVVPPAKGAGTVGVTPLQPPVTPLVMPPASSSSISPGVARSLLASSPTPAPEKARVWAKWFTGLSASIATLGIVAPAFGFRSFLTLLLVGLLIGTCLVGPRFTQSLLIRIGLLLQLVAIFLSFFYSTDLDNIALFLQPIPAALSMICISYGIARWKFPQDAGLLGLQILLSLGVGIVADYVVVPVDRFLVVFPVLAVLVLMLRLACWKAQPVVTLLLAVGGIWAFYFYSRHYDRFQLPLNFSLSVILCEQFVFLSLGFLLLVQTERIRQKAQKQQPTLVQQP